MDFRLGTCASCGAKYRVPATFQADKAKCKSCGGVVELGPVQSSDGGAAAEPKPAAKPVPARKPQPKPAAKPAPKPAAAKPAAAKPKPAAKPAARPAAPKKDSVREAAEAAADRVRGAGRKKPAAASSGAGAGKRSPSRSSRGRGGKSRRSREPKKSNTGMLVGVALIVIALGGGAWFFMNQGSDETQAAENDQASVTTPTDDLTTEETPLDDETTGAEDEPEADPEPEPEPEPEEPEPAKPKEVVDDIDLLAEFEDELPLPETSQADFDEMKQWMATFIDPVAGAAGNRARKKLLDKSKEAFPVILNAFKRVDFSTEEGYRTGDLIQRLLQDICNGNNFDWKYGYETADVVFNKKVVRAWHKAWAQAREHPKAWAKLAKLSDEEAGVVAEPEEAELEDF